MVPVVTILSFLASLLYPASYGRDGTRDGYNSGRSRFCHVVLCTMQAGTGEEGATVRVELETLGIAVPMGLPY